MFFTSCKSHSHVAIHGRSDTDEDGAFFHDFAFLFAVVSINDEWVARVETYTIPINILPCIRSCEEEFIGSDSDDRTVLLGQAVVVRMLFSVG